MRQGDPLSPYLFVTAVEILAIAVRNQENIKGININGLETKLLQFADDTTAVLSDLNSARALFKLLERFEVVSGLKLNVTKTEAMWIGGSSQLSHAFAVPLPPRVSSRSSGSGWPFVRPLVPGLACMAGRRKERQSVGRDGGGTACKDAIVFSVFFVHQMNVKILIGQIL